MAENQAQKTEYQSSWSGILGRMNSIMQNFGGMPMESIYGAFSRAWSNMPQIQNSRVKAISSLPADYSKEELGEFLRSPQTSERPLRNIAQILRWSAYPFFKITKTYQDIPTYRHYTKPLYITEQDAKSESFWREFRLIDKISKEFRPHELGHKANGESGAQGKVFYILRSSIDKSHNKVNYAFAQQLPEDYCEIIGYNNISKYTISFNMMYFLQPGTDYRQFGDLFEPYLEDFNAIFEESKESKNKKFIYATKNDSVCTYKVNGREFTIYPNNVNREGIGNPKMFMQNGRWMYYVSLPIDRVWTFEIDDTTPIVASPFSGLLQTLAQQADYEAAQLSLIMNPLIKIFTGEIPYRSGDNSTVEDDYKLSLGGREMFQAYFNALMAQTNTGGVGLYSAPFQNIKSHDFPESANANSVASSFNSYSTQKSGLSALIPATDNPHQGVAEYSAKLEARFTQCIYDTLEKMLNYLYSTLNLQYDWETKFFGDIYSEATMRADALKRIDKGDLSAYWILAALDGNSILDLLSMSYVVKESGFLETLTPPQTSYTQSSSTQVKETGAPTKTETDIIDTKIEKQTESATE